MEEGSRMPRAPLLRFGRHLSLAKGAKEGGIISTYLEYTYKDSSQNRVTRR